MVAQWFKVPKFARRGGGAILAAWLLAGGWAHAQDPVVASFQDGYLTWTNVDPSLYYTVESRPNLTGSNDWDGSYRAAQDIQSSEDTITAPVGVFYRVVGSTNPLHASGGTIDSTARESASNAQATADGAYALASNALPASATDGWETGSHAGLATGTPLYVYSETGTLAQAAERGNFAGTETIAPLRVDAQRFGHAAGVGASGGDLSVFVGDSAGFNTTGNWNTAVGPMAGYLVGGGSNNGWTAIGDHAGERSTSIGSARWLAIGNHAGEESTNTSSVVVGSYAAYRAYLDTSTVVGPNAGWKATLNDSLALGYFAGSGAVVRSSVMIGNNAGSGSSGSWNTVIGYLAGRNAAGELNATIGPNAGENSRSTSGVFLGYYAGSNAAALSSVIVGERAGINSDGAFNLFAGYLAAQGVTGRHITAVGSHAGYQVGGGSNDAWTAIGDHAGERAASFGPVGNSARWLAIGNHAAEESTNNYSISIGSFSGYRSLLYVASAIGCGAGQYSQLSNSLAIGNFVGSYAAQSNAIFMDVFPRNLGPEYAASNAAIYLDNGSLSLGRGGTTNESALPGTNHLRGAWDYNGAELNGYGITEQAAYRGDWGHSVSQQVAALATGKLDAAAMGAIRPSYPLVCAPTVTVTKADIQAAPGGELRLELTCTVEKFTVQMDTFDPYDAGTWAIAIAAGTNSIAADTNTIRGWEAIAWTNPATEPYDVHFRKVSGATNSVNVLGTW